MFNTDDDILFRVMSSMDNAEKIIEDFASCTINFALTGYYLVNYSETYATK